jgi:hypothetical protein
MANFSNVDGSVFSMTSDDYYCELSRRLGAARKEFQTLSKIWSHANLSIQREVRIFDAFVTSKLLYCLHTAWLGKAELRKLDAVQACCLRRISGTPHSYMSRISNETVLHNTAQHKMSNILLQRQMTLMSKVAIQPDLDILRKVNISLQVLI